MIATYPSVAALLAQEAARGGLHIAPREVWTGGETLDTPVRRRVEQALDCTVRNSYGASEFLTLGWECGHGRMHLNADWAILEPVDERHRPVPPGQPSCSTLLTHLANTVQPLIRYDLGDQLTMRPECCECGSPLPVIEVQGRLDDPLVMAGLKGEPVTLLPMALTTVLEEDAGVFDFQLRQQDERTLVLRLALTGDAAVSAMARCRSALQGFAALQGLKPLRLIEELGPARAARAQRQGVPGDRQGSLSPRTGLRSRHRTSSRRLRRLPPRCPGRGAARSGRCPAPWNSAHPSPGCRWSGPAACRRARC